MQYEVGDKVRVRSDLKAHQKYDGTSAVTPMLKFREQTVTIKRVRKSSVSGKIVYKIEEDADFWWTNEMFTRKSYTPDELFDALLRGAIDEESYKKMLKEAH